MTTVGVAPKVATTKQRESEEPFYGWRYKRWVKPDGSIGDEMVPLRFIDLIYPQEGDQVAEGPCHADVCLRLSNYVRERLENDPDRYAMFNVLIDFSLTDVRPLAPDIIIINGPKPPITPTTGLIHLMGDEGETELMIEVIAKTTRRAEIGPKVRRSYATGVKRLIHIDTYAWSRRQRERELVLRDFRRTETGFKPMNDDPRRVWVDTLNCWIVIEGDQVVLRDQAGELIPDYPDVKRQMAAERARADAAEAELRRLRAERNGRAGQAEV